MTDNAETTAPRAPGLFAQLRGRVLNTLGGRAVLATLILMIVGGAVYPIMLSGGTFLSLLPFVATLAIASIGQHLVVQQRGLDISIAGTMSLAAVIVTKLPEGGASTGELMWFIFVALAMGMIVGLINGLIITLLKVPALVTTIGMNSILFGAALKISGSVPSQAPPQLANFAISLSLGVPNTVWVAILAAVITIFVVDRTTIGRRFVGVSVSPAAAFAVAIPVRLYRILTYVSAGLLYAIAGVIMAGYLSVPNIFFGNSYILASVAAVVVGGNSIAGGSRGSLFATVVGAFFLTYLGQLVLTAGLDKSTQYVVQALIVIGGVGLPMLMRRTRSAGPSAPTAAAIRAEPARVAASGAAPILEMDNVRKSFGPVEALKGVTFRAYPGEVHAVLGENGAGKSTMINIAAGVLRASSGTVTLKGEAVTALGPHDRREKGISVAYQHPALAPDLTVFENLQLAAPEIAPARAAELIASIATAQLRMAVHQLVGDLSLAQLHVVEIARALATDPAVLILDEPTEPFQHDDIRQLFALIKSLRAKGVAVIYVSHRLHEVTELADRISIMRDGEMVASRDAADISDSEMISLIAGRPLGQIFPPKGTGAGQPVLEVSGFAGNGFAGVDMVAHAGEIIGLAGVEGEGQREFLRALAGVNPHTAGRLVLNGQPIEATGPAASRTAGIGFVSDDRHAEGLFLNLSVRENLGIGVLQQVSQGGLISRGKETRLAGNVAAQLRIRTPSVEASVADLSGGNQQKVLFGREISAGPKVLLVDEPTKGVDIGARTEIYQRLRSLASEGTTVIIAASDGVELEGLCDRVFVFARGSIQRELTGADVTDTAITEANLTATASRAATAIKSSSAGWWGKFLKSDHFPALVLIVLTAGIALGTNAVNEFFLSGFNIGQMLALLAILCFIALAQFSTIVVGGIDLSVGPLAGFVVVMASFLMPREASGLTLAGSAVLMVALCAAFGYLQGVLITMVKLPAIVVTLASFIGLQGVSLLLRPRPEGTISNSVSEVFGYPILGVPAGMVMAFVAVVVFEVVLFRRAAGRQLRAVGSNPLASLRLGVDVGRVVRIAFTLAGAFAGVAGLMLAGQIGIGSGTVGVDYSLMSITAVVLAGVSVAGGRGSAVSVLFGAALVQATTSASSFLNADSSWQYTVVGAITLVGACLFSIARRSGAAGPKLAH
ncbi:ATP-binding cassette domain-containing protein [Tabrizicola sp. BL-A-41-H6]|uniref:ATP-binding cassette domain-containing protein n=1 Tax=Tabrizicola sp. BL-A-41-H6 TaxID=3421107 RepID=UPI003D67D768